MQIFPLFPNSEDAIIIYEKIGEDIMDSILEILLTGLMDPLIWIKSMSTLGTQKSKKQSTLFFLIYYSLVVGKGIWGEYTDSSRMKEVLMFVILLYITFATLFLFEGKLYEKAIYICIFYCILIVSELCMIELYSFLFHEDFNGVINNKTSNLVCGCLAKILQIFLCYCFFGSKKAMDFFYKNKEKISLFLICFAMLSNLFFKNIVSEESSNAILLFETVLLLLLWYILSSLFTLKEKDKYIGGLKLEANCNSEGQVMDIDQFKHDFSTNVFIMKNLWYYKEYDKLESYMNDVFADVEKVELLFEHPNFAVRILVSSLIQMAARLGIPFNIQIEVNEFGMTDEDVCTIFQNLVLNGLNLAAKVPVKEAYVCLQVMHIDNGYEIRCRNTCVGIEKIQKSSKQKQESIIFGMELVDRLIRKYHGTVEKNSVRQKKENICQAEMLIRIPYNQN